MRPVTVLLARANEINKLSRDFYRIANILSTYLAFMRKSVAWHSNWAPRRCYSTAAHPSNWRTIEVNWANWRGSIEKLCTRSRYGQLIFVLFWNIRSSPILRIFLQSDTPGSSVQFMIVPCGYAITAKIFSQKKLISRIEIDRPQLLRFNGTSHNDRFLLKIFPTNADDIMQNGKNSSRLSLNNNFDENFNICSAINFKVIATSKQRFTSIPTLPSLTTVEEIKSRRTCTEATIMWHSSPDTHNIKLVSLFWSFNSNGNNFDRPTSIRYCVSVIKLKSRNIEDNALTINTCNLSKSQRKLFATIEKCFVPTTTNRYVPLDDGGLADDWWNSFFIISFSAMVWNDTQWTISCRATTISFRWCCDVNRRDYLIKRCTYRKAGHITV